MEDTTAKDDNMKTNNNDDDNNVDVNNDVVNDNVDVDVDVVDDPLLKKLPPPPRSNNCVRDGDYLILIFGDDKTYFAQCLTKWKGNKAPPLKINKRSYSTANLIGLSYGTVLELDVIGGKLIPLPDGEGLLPDYIPTTTTLINNNGGGGVGGTISNDDDEVPPPQQQQPTILEDEEAIADDNTYPSIPSNNNIDQRNDNRDIIDNNTAQNLSISQIQKLKRKKGGSHIVNALIENSTTFAQKTEFSQAKYIKRKQTKYQPRCRMVQCTPLSICETMFIREPRKLMNMREDTLGQILSYSNISAGCQVLCLETCQGIVTGSLASRMGGYGKVISVYSGQQPSFNEMLQRFNLSFAENHSIKWLHSGDIFNNNDNDDDDDDNQKGQKQRQLQDEIDLEKLERNTLVWPCPLQDHTREYLIKMESNEERNIFLEKRSMRFARKLTRSSPMEVIQQLHDRKCDSIVLVSKYDPTSTLLKLLPFLASSSPFVVYCEYVEPLTECFKELKKQNLAINIRLTDTWKRDYQVLPGRTHPSMNMSQSGGYLLTGIKLCPLTGHNELDDELLKKLSSTITRRGGNRKKKSCRDNNNNKRSSGGGGGRKKKNKATSTNGSNNDNDDGRDPKRIRIER